MVKDNNYCVIMAGGIGSRFWPMSRQNFPKQFHDILGTGNTLMQMTYNRFLKTCPPENILVVTNDVYKELVLTQLPDMKAEQVLCEPFRRNTAPCVAYANFKIAELCPDANVIVAPADHLVLNEQRFEEIIDLAIEEASETQNLVTLGIKPSRPDTGYGYIQFEYKSDARDTRVKTVKTFTEKPDIDLARKFLASGEFYWNSGIFIWSLDNIQAAYKRDLPDVYSLFESGKGKYNTDEELDYIQEIYAKCENISIDYGIMEKANNVSLILSDFGWSDLGTWGSLYTHVDLDLHNNATVGDNTMLYNCTNNMVYSADDKLTVLHGLDGFIVVDTPEAMLICKKSDEQKIKQFVNDIKMNKKDEFL